MTVKRNFSRQHLREMTWGDEPEGYEIISNELYDTSRWSIYYEMIFKFEDRFYKTTYSVGATESQDESPYEYDGNEIECIEVKPVSKTIIVYEPI